jgi:hypothetical protein
VLVAAGAVAMATLPSLGALRGPPPEPTHHSEERVPVDDGRLDEVGAT